MNFAQTLDKTMKERNISNYEMSKKTGISDSLIGYWRKGERVPKADNLLNIANFLECSADYLLGRTDVPNGYSNNNISNSDNVAFGENAQVKVQSKNSMNDEIITEFENILNSLTLNEKADLIKAMYQFKRER